MQQQKKSGNPAVGFLIMAGFNVLAAISFVVFYFLYRGAGGESSVYLLVAALVSIAAAAGLLVAYTVFKRKLTDLSPK